MRVDLGLNLCHETLLQHVILSHVLEASDINEDFPLYYHRGYLVLHYLIYTVGNVYFSCSKIWIVALMILSHMLFSFTQVERYLLLLTFLPVQDVKKIMEKHWVRGFLVAELTLIPLFLS